MRNKYDAYLRSAHWQRKRQEALEHYGHKCWVCSAKKHLHVHHKVYIRRGHEPMDDLVVLCESCHNAAHKLAAEGRVRLRYAHEALAELNAGKPIKKARRGKRGRAKREAAMRV